MSAKRPTSCKTRTTASSSSSLIQQDYSLIGTTDVEHKGSPREAKISDAEINYLCKVVNAHFTRQIAPKDVIWTYAGVRPLCDDESDSPQAVTRDYTLELSGESDGAPLLSVFGGKLTTYRKLAQAACNKLKPWFSQMGRTGPPTAGCPVASSTARFASWRAPLRWN